MSDVSYTPQDVVALLAPTLGEERALELVRGALGSLGVVEAAFPGTDVVRVLELIGRSPGFVGSVARFALARFTLKDANAAQLPLHSSASGLRAVRGEALSRSELTDLLAPTLGEEKSDELVLETLRRLGYPLDVFSLPQGLAVLENLALVEGLVGVAASFARAHLLMRAPKP
jgi:hypothetical protein